MPVKRAKKTEQLPCRTCRLIRRVAAVLLLAWLAVAILGQFD